MRLDELDEDAARGVGVEEGDFVAAGTLARLAIEEFDASAGKFVECGVDVVDAKSDVVEGRFAAVALEEFIES